MEKCDTAERQDWMRILSLSSWDDLERVSAGISKTVHSFLRPPETGLIMLRGRMGGSGALFNVGEATVTRCSVKLTGGYEGHSYLLGRNLEHARVAAICDGLLQQLTHHDHVLKTVVEPLREKIAARRLLAGQKAAATKVEFFTLVRGDG